MVAVRFLSGLVLLVFVFFGASAFGEEIPAAQPPVADNVAIPSAPPPVPDNVVPAKMVVSTDNGYTDNGYIDRSHDFVDEETYKMIEWFDGRFSKKSEREKKKAEIKLKWTNELRAEKGEGVRYRSSLNANVHLPHLEKRLKLVVMEETGKEVTPVPGEPGTPVANSPSRPNMFRALHTELRYYARETKAGYAFLAVGSRFVWTPEVFVRARFLWRIPVGDNSFLSPSVTPFWQDYLGVGVTPQLDFIHPFGHDYIFQWSNSATMFEKRLGFLWGTEVSLSRVLSPLHAISFAVGANGATQPTAIADRFGMVTNNYRVSAKYRRKIYRPWLFLEFVPEANWRRNLTGGRDIVPAVTLRLEINSEGHRALVPVPVIVREDIPVPFPRYDQ
jgi:hypothetical protein